MKAADRFAISVSHISNADLGAFNPGTEILGFGYSIPVGRKRVALDGLVAGR